MKDAERREGCAGGRGIGVGWGWIEKKSNFRYFYSCGGWGEGLNWGGAMDIITIVIIREGVQISVSKDKNINF